MKSWSGKSVLLNGCKRQEPFPSCKFSWNKQDGKRKSIVSVTYDG